MLHAPEKYLNSILSKAEIERDITLLIHHLIVKNDSNLHFIIDEKELELSELLAKQCKRLNGAATFNFQVGQKVLQLKNPKINYSKSALQSFFCPFKVVGLEPSIKLVNSEKKPKIVENLNKFIPITNSGIERISAIQARIEAFQRIFKASVQADFFCNEKLLVIGNKNLYLTIPKDFPACFISENENGIAEIEYNSPLLPKIAILKNINLLDKYRQQEINGEYLSFSSCIFVGSSKFENSINIIRNYYNQRRFPRVVFIGDKDIQLDLGNNQIPLRWKWTIPEINFFKNGGNIQHKRIIIQNVELEKAITEFYKTIREIENRHTISLRSIFRFIRQLYYDWNLKQETTFIKLVQIQAEFEITLKQLLIETLGNIYPDFDFYEYQNPISRRFSAIIDAIKSHNKNERLKYYQTRIDQLILPSFLCNANKCELNQIFKSSKYEPSFHDLKDLSKLETMQKFNFENVNRPFYALTANRNKTEIVSLARSDSSDITKHKIISSIYGNGKIERLIERLGKSRSEYNLLLYSIEEKAWKYHLENYISELNREYISQDRFEISGVAFSDNYYQFTSFDELIDALSTTKHDHHESENYQITFTDGSRFKLPSSKSVLRVVGNEKYIVLVEDLSIGEKVLIYSNPDKKLLRTIIELKNSDLIEKADEYSLLWRTCLNDAYQDNIMREPLYHRLVKNHFSVSESTFRKYLEGEVMFPRSFSDLVIIAKTINDQRLSFDFLKNTMKPKIEEYRGKEIEYGFKFSNSINHFIISGEADEFISEWLRKAEIESIVSQIPMKTIKDIELITQNIDD